VKPSRVLRAIPMLSSRTSVLVLSYGGSEVEEVAGLS
jgi:hypothetical protein